MSAERLTRHRARLEETTGLTDLIRVARELLIEDRENDNMTVFVQAFAGGSTDAEMGVKLYNELEPWTGMVTDSVASALGDSPMANTIPQERVAQAISALFLGIELLDNLDPERANAHELFDSLEPLALLLEGLLQSPILQNLITPES